MVKVKVDGRVVEALPGTTVLEAAERAGVYIPTLCTVEGLYEGASCRMCVVKTPTGRLFPACTYRVYRDEEFVSDSPELWEVRRVNFEFVLKFHKFECWSCARKGECELAALCKALGVEGLPVCSECPLPPEECLLLKGELCLGALTQSGCSAECIASGGKCEGCRSPITRVDALERALRRYGELGFNSERILEEGEVYWNAVPAFATIKGLAKRVMARA